MEDRITLKASAPWLSTPSALLLASNGRTFEIEVCSFMLAYLFCVLLFACQRCEN